MKTNHSLKLTDTGEDIRRCTSNDCGHAFNYSKSFFTHVENYHCLLTPLGIEDEPLQQSVNEIPNIEDDLDKKWIHESFSYETHFTETVAKLRMSTKCTGADLGRCIESYESFFAGAMANMRKRTEDYLQSVNVDITSSKAQEFLKQYDEHDSFLGMKDLRGQLRALRKYCKFVDPVEVCVKTVPTKIKNPETNKEEIILEPKYMQYVPVIETLKMLLSNPEVMDYVKTKI